eukprot:TRINITY_DN2604_c0_g5_i1.p1 TRINITY_DN2604_c0_g5~~TRINITY_DN2604_c0_g5_i1.p1  ORF type:complete len:400 (+),score=55.39 TRINITY_DN2604_c0_g5_i1:2047-3246(+)
MKLILAILISLVVCKPILVVEFLRHGARSPLGKDKFFPYTNWKRFGYLTAVGERQHYLLGHLRRSKYIEKEKFLPETYDPSLIYARSSNVRRTMMSLESYLHGLYPTGLNKLNENQMGKSKSFLLPQLDLTIDESIITELGSDSNPFSIPVFHYEVFKNSNDRLLLLSNCPISKATRLRYMRARYHHVFNKYMETWRSLANSYRNITIHKLRKGTVALGLCDFLLCADSDGVRPNRVPDYVLRQCGKFIGDVQRERVEFDERCVKASTKPFAVEVIAWMEKVIGRETKVRYVVYGAHDTTLSRLLVGLKAMDGKIRWESMPPFAANVMFEVSEEEGNYFVNVFFNDRHIHRSNYKDFKRNFERVGDISVSYEEACKVPDDFYIDQEIYEYDGDYNFDID